MPLSTLARYTLFAFTSLASLVLTPPLARAGEADSGSAPALDATGTGRGAAEQGAVRGHVKVIDSIGIRVGGYGFRNTVTADDDMAPGHVQWKACRMNGLGVFAGRDLNEYFYLEGGLDTYFTETFPTGESTGNYDTPIDRVSGLLSIAGGARAFPDSFLSPFVQLGVGAEVTRVSLPQLGLQDTALLPLGFFGVGGNLRLTERLRFGASLRVNVMGYYDDDQFQTELDPHAELATQGQFFLWYAL